MNRVRLIVTGSRAFADRTLVWDALALARWELGPFTLVHGAAPGADTIAAEWVEQHPELQCREEPHRADWARLGRAAGPVRNQAMVDAGAVLVLAFPLHNSRGTRHCIGRAEAAGIPVRVLRSAEVSR